MKTYLGITGYVFLIIGAVFIDTPIFALLAIPLFITGVIITTIFYDKILQKHNKLGLLGILLICGTLAYSAIEFNQYLVLVSRDQFDGFFFSGWLKVFGIVVLNLLASYLVYLGLGKENISTKNNPLFGWWLSAIFLVPFVIILMLISYWTGFWLGG